MNVKELLAEFAGLLLIALVVVAFLLLKGD